MASRTRTIALFVSLLVHATALLVLVYRESLAPPRETAPIEVRLLEEPPPPEAAEPPPAPRLHFRRERLPPQARPEALPPPRRSALAPPPPDAELSAEATGGGLAIEPVAAGTLPGFTLAGAGGGRAGVGLGTGNGLGGAGDFERFIGGLRQGGLDVVFVVDATGSMGWLVEEVKDHVRLLARWIRRLVPVTRFGVVAYRDHDGPGFVTRVQPLTLSSARVQRFLEGLETRGGGDIPEAVDAGLAAAIEEAGWSPDAKHVVILLGDAPPHPDRLEATLALARAFHAAGGTVTAVDVSFDANPHIAAARLGRRVEDLRTLDPRGVMEPFRAIAGAGGGDASTLEGESRLMEQVALLIFGRRWAEDVRPLLGDL